MKRPKSINGCYRKDTLTVCYLTLRVDIPMVCIDHNRLKCYNTKLPKCEMP